MAADEFCKFIARVVAGKKGAEKTCRWFLKGTLGCQVQTFSPGVLRCASSFDCASQLQECRLCVPTWLAACVARFDVGSPCDFIVGELIVALCIHFFGMDGRHEVSAALMYR